MWMEKLLRPCRINQWNLFLFLFLYFFGRKMISHDHREDDRHTTIIIVYMSFWNLHFSTDMRLNERWLLSSFILQWKCLASLKGWASVAYRNVVGKHIHVRIVKHSCIQHMLTYEFISSSLCWSRLSFLKESEHAFDSNKWIRRKKNGIDCITAIEPEHWTYRIHLFTISKSSIIKNVLPIGHCKSF